MASNLKTTGRPKKGATEEPAALVVAPMNREVLLEQPKGRLFGRLTVTPETIYFFESDDVAQQMPHTEDDCWLKVNGMLHNRFGGNTIPGDNNPHDC